MQTDNAAWTGKKPLDRREESVDVLDRLSWSVQPPLGLIFGDYYREENYFAPHFSGDQGYHGILEVVKHEGKIVHVEFNEITSRAYYTRLYQGVSKRLSSFGFYQATKARTAQTLVVMVNGITAVERQMLEGNRLDGEFDLVTGASNSVKRSMLPLARLIAPRLGTASGSTYCGMAKNLGSGITARLQVVTSGGRITSCSYDEIFADTPEEIRDEAQKKYYRQSKYHCMDYEPTYPDGFNTIFDLLSARVLERQDLLDIGGLPWTVDSEKRPRNPEWDTYLELARTVDARLRAEGALA